MRYLQNIFIFCLILLSKGGVHAQSNDWREIPDVVQKRIGQVRNITYNGKYSQSEFQTVFKFNRPLNPVISLRKLEYRANRKTFILYFDFAENRIVDIEKQRIRPKKWNIKRKSDFIIPLE